MDRGAEQVGQRLVDHSMSLEESTALEAIGHDHDPEMPTAGTRSPMTDVALGFVADFKVQWTQAVLKSSFDRLRHSRHQWFPVGRIAHTRIQRVPSGSTRLTSPRRSSETRCDRA